MVRKEIQLVMSENPIERNLRRGWSPKAYMVPRLEGGKGSDIVIRVDGTYFNEAEAVRMQEYWTSVLREHYREAHSGEIDTGPCTDSTCNVPWHGNIESD